MHPADSYYTRVYILYNSGGHPQTKFFRQVDLPKLMQVGPRDTLHGSTIVRAAWRREMESIITRGPFGSDEFNGVKFARFPNLSEKAWVAHTAAPFRVRLFEGLWGSKYQIVLSRTCYADVVSDNSSGKRLYHVHLYQQKGANFRPFGFSLGDEDLTSSERRSFSAEQVKVIQRSLRTVRVKPSETVFDDIRHNGTKYPPTEDDNIGKGGAHRL